MLGAWVGLGQRFGKYEVAARESGEHSGGEGEKCWGEQAVAE